MPSPFEADLDGLRQRLLTMASLAAQSVQGSQGCARTDDDLARQIEAGDSRIDE
jgi:phosphate uptake regulator